MAKIVKMLLPVIVVGLSACDDDTSGLVGDQQFWFYNNPDDLVSNEPIPPRITFRYNTLSYTGGASLYLEVMTGHGGNVITNMGYSFLHVTAGTEGEGNFDWTGRHFATGNTESPAGRTLPAAPPYIYLRMSYGAQNWIRSRTRGFAVKTNAYDSDGDGYSDAIEIENSVGRYFFDEYNILHPSAQWLNSSDLERPPMITRTHTGSLYANRGTKDYSLAIGTPSDGSIYNSIRIADNGTGYYYFPSMDQADTDNYGVLETINKLENVGRLWYAEYPAGPRKGIGDISLEPGGYWADHESHRNGLDVDMRYVRNNSTEGTLDFNNAGEASLYSFQRTLELVDFLLEMGAVLILVDSRAGFAQTSVVQNAAGHSDHFHVRFADPDN